MSNEKLTTYVNELFSPYEGIKSVTELKADILTDLEERFHELQGAGKDDDTALEITLNSIGDINQTVHEVANYARSLERQVQISLSAARLQGTDFSGVALHEAQFKASAMRGVNFKGANLTDCLFRASDVRESNFDGTYLTDCTFDATSLKDANFHRSVLARTTVNVSSLHGAKFMEAKLTEVRLSKIVLTGTIFEHCLFNGVDFTLCDMRGMHFSGQTFIGVNFDRSVLNNALFKGATLRNVSFRIPFSVTNKSYREFKTVSFDGAMMDKVTYAGLKALWVVDLSKVTII